MKILRSRRRLANLDVVARRELKEPFDARARMFRALALVPMRQEQHHARQQIPLVLARRNELVDHDLSAVCKIAKLRFPKDQRLRKIAAEPVFEAEYRG